MSCRFRHVDIVLLTGKPPWMIPIDSDRISRCWFLTNVIVLHGYFSNQSHRNLCSCVSFREEHNHLSFLPHLDHHLLGAVYYEKLWPQPYQGHETIQEQESTTIVLKITILLHNDDSSIIGLKSLNADAKHHFHSQISNIMRSCSGLALDSWFPFAYQTQKRVEVQVEAETFKLLS